MNGMDEPKKTYRLWLCHNELQNIEDMSSIAKSINLKEITIENNPISLAGDCVSFLVSYLPMLVSLNQLQITEQVRRAANAWRKSKENTDQTYQHLSSDVSSSIRREEIISNARTNWELIRSQQANIINGSQRQVNQIKKTIKSKLTSNNSSSSISTGSLSSNINTELSNGTGTNMKMSKNLIDIPKYPKSKLLRSTSHDNTCSITLRDIDDVDSDYHLPPMMDQFVDMPKTNTRSASSTRPNVDSESDFVGSDSDEPKSFKSRVPTTPPINAPPTNISSKPPSPVEIIIREDENDENDNGNEKSCSSHMALPPIEKPLELVASPTTDSPEELSLKDIENNNNTSTANNNSNINYNNEHTRTPSPNLMQMREKEKAVLTIIDNSSGISLQPTINIENDSVIGGKSKVAELKLEPTDIDKLSSLASKTSAKTSSESINNAGTISPNNEERQVHSSQTNYHPRNRSGINSRRIGPPLVRSQTARNLSSHLSNQTATVGAGNQQNANLKRESKKEIDKDREQGKIRKRKETKETK